MLKGLCLCLQLGAAALKAESSVNMKPEQRLAHKLTFGFENGGKNYLIYVW